MVRACRLLARAMIPPLQSLVKYDNPVLVSTTKDNKKKDKKTGKVRPDRAPTRASGRAPLGVERRLLARSGALRARDVSWSQLHHAQARGASVLPPPSAGACARLVRRLTRVPSLPPPTPPLCSSSHLRCTPQKELPPVEQKPGITQTEDILNSILPPRCVRAPRGFSQGARWTKAVTG